MNRWAGALLTLACVAGGAGETAKAPFRWLQRYGSSEHDNWREREDEVLWPKVAWHVPEARGEPTVDGGRIYSGGAALLAIDAATGRIEARIEAGGEFRYAMAPVLADQLVIARRTDGVVQAFGRDLGGVVWEQRGAAADPDTRRTGALRGNLYVYAEGPRIHAIDARQGQIAWTHGQPGGSAFAMVPAIDEQRVYAGSEDGTFVALDRKTGREMWTHRQPAPYGLSDPVVIEGVLLVGDRGVRDGRRGEVRAFDPKTGRVLWEFGFDATGLSTPGHRPGQALLGYGRTAAWLDLKTQRPDRLRTSANAFGSPTVVGETFLFGTLDGNLCAHRGTRSELSWRFHVEGEIDVAGEGQVPHQVHDFVHTGRRILVATTNGLYCLVQDPEKRGKHPHGAVIR